MIKITVTESLAKEIVKKFGKQKALEIVDIFETLKESPQKGQVVGKVGNIIVKELKYETFRFYFITNGYELKLLLKGEIVDLLFKFVRMSKKNDQQNTIDEIKYILKKLGIDKF